MLASFFMIMDENTPADKRKLMQKYLKDENTETLSHPPYTPDLVPCDFLLFPHIRKCSAQGHPSDQSFSSVFYLYQR